MTGLKIDETEGLVTQEKHSGCIIRVTMEGECVESPREWDNFGTIIYSHRRYILGEVEVNNPTEAYEHISHEVWVHLSDEDCKRIIELAIKEDGDCRDEYRNFKPGEHRRFIEYFEDELIEELLRSSSFSEDFLEIISGYVFQLPVYLYDHSGITISTSSFSCPWDSGQVGIIFATKKKAEEEGIPEPENLLRDEIKIFDSFLRGEVYWFDVYDIEAGYFVDSCGGFYGNEGIKEALQEARASAERKPQQELRNQDGQDLVSLAS